jgi:hypothetical protein
VINTNNSKSTPITTLSNYTIVVLPQLMWWDKFTSFFNPQSGPGVGIAALLTALVSIAGTIGIPHLWRSRRRKWKDDIVY